MSDAKRGRNHEVSNGSEQVTESTRETHTLPPTTVYSMIEPTGISIATACAPLFLMENSSPLVHVPRASLSFDIEFRMVP